MTHAEQSRAWVLAGLPRRNRWYARSWAARRSGILRCLAKHGGIQRRVIALDRWVFRWVCKTVVPPNTEAIDTQRFPGYNYTFRNRMITPRMQAKVRYGARPFSTWVARAKAMMEANGFPAAIPLDWRQFHWRNDRFGRKDTAYLA